MTGRAWALVVINLVLLTALGGRIYWRYRERVVDRLTLVRAGFEHHPVVVEQLGTVRTIERGEGTPPLDAERFLDMYEVQGAHATGELWLEVETDGSDQMVGILDSMLVLRDGTRFRVEPRLPDGGGFGARPFQRAPPPVNAIPRAVRDARGVPRRVLLLFCLDRSMACRRLASVMRRDRRARRLLDEYFELILVDVADDANRSVLRRYGRDVRRLGTPVLTLLSDGGSAAASRGPRRLLEGDYPDIEAVVDLLRSWRGPSGRARPSTKRSSTMRRRSNSTPMRL